MAVIKLGQITIPRSMVELSFDGPDGKPAQVEVRAITTHDLMMMLGSHAPALSMAFGRLMTTAKLKGAITPQDVQTVLGLVMAAAPDFMGTLLALLNDDPTPEGQQNARDLNLVDQLAMLNEAALLTLRSEAQLKKLIEAAKPTVESIYGAMAVLAATESKTPRPSSRNGIGGSGVRSVS